MKFIKIISILLLLMTVIFSCSQMDSYNQGATDNDVHQKSLPRAVNPTAFTGDNRYFVFDDMVFDRSEPSHQYFVDAYSGKTDSRSETSRGLKQNSVTLWPNGIVYYYYAGSFTTTEINTIRSAMDSIQLTCNVKFVESTIDWYRYEISKINDPNIGGQSTVGYIAAAACQLVSINWGTCVHEFLHGLGISHEHNRYDRQVTIRTENINPTYLSQFNVVPQTSGSTYYDYDFDSIMHYGAYAFSINGQITIDAGTHAIGQRNHLSEIDKRTLLTLYPYPATKLFRFKNRLTNEYMHTESNYGWVEIGAIQPYWWSAMWIIETSDRGYMHIKNRWTGKYLHCESNSYYVQVGDIQSYWWSAEWLPVEHGGTMRLQNRWTLKYPHIENRYGWLQLGNIESSWLSADWILEPVN